MKFCPKCRINKNENEFKRHKWCSVCCSEYSKQHRIENIERYRAHDKETSSLRSEQGRVRKQEAIAQGKCGVCHENPLSTKTMCVKCAHKVKEQTANYRKTAIGALKEILKSARIRAKHSNRQFDLTVEWIMEKYKEQNGCCAISGLKLDFESDFGHNTMHPRAPSLDRIDANLGYTQDNTRLVCAQVNIALGSWGNAYFYEMCEAILKRKVVL